MKQNFATQMLNEMMLFASFSAAEQRYIRRSLDIGLDRGDAAKRWGRNPFEKSQIKEQARRYAMLDAIRACIPDDPDPESAESFMGLMITLTAGDLGEGKLAEFEAYQFLYERLLGPSVRPWLVSVYCAAAAMPALNCHARRQLLQSIPVENVSAAGWTIHASVFVPEWVEKVAEAVN
jgi:hypothetical protein